MSSDLRELFERDVDVEPPHDLAERALHGARTRRRNRFVVGGAVLATVVVVLGVVIVSGQLRSDSEPRPTDVAALPSVLPSADSVANLEPGAISKAAAAYVSHGRVVFVSGDPDDDGALRRLPWNGQAAWGDFFTVEAADSVALSPDGKHAVVLAHGADVPMIVDVAAAGTDYPDALVTVHDSGAADVVVPSTVVWESDSQHFLCSCAVDGQSPRLVRVGVDGTWEPIDADVSPLQVTAGTAGVAVQLEANGGPWVSVSDLAPAIPASYAAALGRGTEPTYIAFRGSGYTLGEAGGSETFSGVLPSAGVEAQYVVVTDVDAVLGGFVAVVAEAEPAEGLGDPADVVVSSKAVFIRNDGAYQEFMSLPTGTVAASFAGDLVAP